MAKKKKAARKAGKKKPAAKKAKKKVAKKMPKAKKAKPAAKKKRKPNPAFMKALTPSPALAAVVGSSPLPRTQVIKKIWDYIRKNGLQDSVNRRNINADERLRPLFGASQISMFQLATVVNKHLS
jgi:chromatin remodeling complex protein RSC6